MIKIFPFILYLLLIALHQVILRDATAIYEASFNLPCLIVLLVATYKSEMVGVWFGFAAGLVVMAPSPPGLGWQALALAVLALITHYCRERLNLESIRSRLLLVFGGVVVHNAVTLVIQESIAAPYLLGVAVLTGAAYTTLFGWVFFLFKDEVITLQKVKALF